jgi:hypothetical protein
LGYFDDWCGCNYFADNFGRLNAGSGFDRFGLGSLFGDFNDWRRYSYFGSNFDKLSASSGL